MYLRSFFKKNITSHISLLFKQAFQKSSIKFKQNIHIVWLIRLIVNKLHQTASSTKGPHLDYFRFGFNQNFSCLSTSHECMINPHKGSGALLFQASKHFHKLRRNTMSFNDLRLHTSLPFALCIEQWDNSGNQQTGGLIGPSYVGNKTKVAEILNPFHVLNHQNHI